MSLPAEGLDFFQQSAIYLGAALVCVPLSQRLGLGSVLGYLFGGMLIGPAGMGWISNGEVVLHFAEFGVVLMMFLVGLEMEPKELWHARNNIFGLGGLQVGVTMVGAWAWFHYVAHWGHVAALVAGMGIAMSSTAIVLQTIQESGHANTPAGRAAFGVLLFQDLAVIPLLLLLSLMTPNAKGDFAWLDIVLPIAVMLGFVVSARFALRPILRMIANTGQREIFIALALFLVVGAALTMRAVGLSMALGAFLAGMLLANSEYRHELELDIAPFKGLLLGLFFIAIGMSVDLRYVATHWITVLSVATTAVLIKIILFYPIARLFKHPREIALPFAFVVSQIGEFAFVLFSEAERNQLLQSEQTAVLKAGVVVSMVFTPLLMLLYRRVLLPTLFRQNNAMTPDAIEEQRPVIIAGVGRFGQMVSRVLMAMKHPITVIDNDPNHIEMLRGFGWKCYYGDASRLDVLEMAGAHKAKLLVIAMNDATAVIELVRLAQQHFPNLKLVVRAHGRTDSFELLDLGVAKPVRETFAAALEASAQALEALGHEAYAAQRIIWQFRKHDEDILVQTAKIRHDREQMISTYGEARQDLEELLTREHQQVISDDPLLKEWGRPLSQETPPAADTA